MGRRILYLMHVDWCWIKQRPQFLAEELAKENEVRVLHRRRIARGPQLTDNSTAVSVAPLLPVPWSWRTLRWVTAPMQQSWLARTARKFNPDTIWLTYPSLIDAVPDELRGLPIIYDCMDDALGFAASEYRLGLLARLEESTVRRAAQILCSSEHLGKLLVERYGGKTDAKVTVVRNAMSSEMTLDSDTRVRRNSAGSGSGGRLAIAYIGTIAEWVDFELLLTTLECNSKVEFHLVGPLAIRETPRHERLILHEPVPHHELAEYATRFDAFVMPFKLSPLIEGVDPVKLYEYLSFGREVISVRYAEVERFGPYVCFYQTASEFMALVNDLVSHPVGRKGDAAEIQEFLRENTWSSRGRQINEVLGRLGPSIGG